MRNVRVFGAWVVLAQLCGCASPHYENPSHPNLGANELNTDQAQCRHDNSKITIRNGYDTSTDVTVDQAGVDACLAAKGWQPAAK
jgi:hypothetical protein